MNALWSTEIFAVNQLKSLALSRYQINLCPLTQDYRSKHSCWMLLLKMNEMEILRRVEERQKFKPVSTTTAFNRHSKDSGIVDVDLLRLGGGDSSCSGVHRMSAPECGVMMRREGRSSSLVDISEGRVSLARWNLIRWIWTSWRFEVLTKSWTCVGDIVWKFLLADALANCYVYYFTVSHKIVAIIVTITLSRRVIAIIVTFTVSYTVTVVADPNVIITLTVSRNSYGSLDSGLVCILRAT